MRPPPVREAVVVALIAVLLGGCVVPVSSGLHLPPPVTERAAQPEPAVPAVAGADPTPGAGGEGDTSLAAQLARVAEPAGGPRYVFVGLAMSDQSPAFLGDIRILDRLLAHAYGRAYRSVLLSNAEQYEPLRDLPLATPDNIEAVFRRLARLRTPQDRFIVLFTSHGSPGGLADTQADFGATWIVDGDALGRWVRSLAPNRTWVVISSCYSGSLLGQVEGRNVVAMTAADRDRTSLGCGTTSRNTFFVGALARHLDLERTFAEVWAGTDQLLRVWERRYRYDAARPQLRFGQGVAALRAAPLSEF